MTRVVQAIGVAVFLVLASVYAQEPAKDPSIPGVSADVQRSVAELARKAGGLTDAMTVLQKELDATVAQIQRAAQQAQAQCAAVPGFELSQTLTSCVKKRDEPKK